MEKQILRGEGNKALRNEIVLSTIIAIILRHIGAQFTWSQIFNWGYFVRHFTVTIDVLILWETVKFFTKYYDIKVTWEDSFKKRSFIQFVVVSFFSLTAISFLEYFFRYSLYGEHLDEQYFKLYAPILVLISILLSLHYKTVYFNRVIEESNLYITFIPLIKGSVTKKIPIQKVAYFYYENRIVFAVKNNGISGVVDFSLNSLSEKLNPQCFLKVNRQFILSRKSIVKYQEIENRKLEIFVSPPTNSNSRIIISNKKATRIKKWINSN